MGARMESQFAGVLQPGLTNDALLGKIQRCQDFANLVSVMGPLKLRLAINGTVVEAGQYPVKPVIQLSED